MGKSNVFETSFLNHIFCNLPIAGIGDYNGLLPSLVAGNLYVSLHTSDPLESGNQGSSEVAYTGYSRISVPRSSSSWAVANGSASNISEIDFPQCTSGGSNITHVGIGVSLNGSGILLYSSALTHSYIFTNGDAPKFVSGSLTINED